MLRPSTNVIIPRRQQQTQLSRNTRGFAVCEQRANILNEVTNNTYNNKRSSRGPPAVSLADHPRSQDITADLRASGAAFEFGGHTARALDADLVILSPGVPTTAPLVQSALRQGVPVRSEIELASAVCPGHTA